MSEYKIPEVVPVACDGVHYFIVCPYCKKIHNHGAVYGHRVAHCDDEIDSERRSGGYTIVQQLSD